MSLVRVAHIHATIARRQRSLWISVVPLTGFAVIVALASPGAPRTGGGPDLAFAAQMIAIFTGIGYAAAFGDFFASPAQLGIPDVELSTPTRPLALRTARLLGTFAIVATPSLVALVLLAAWQTGHGHPAAILTAVAVALAVLAPSGLIAMGLSALAGALLPRGLARVVAVLVWLWIIFSSPLVPVPNLNGTVLNLVGDYVAQGLFGADTLYDPAGPLGLAPSPRTAAVSLVWQACLILILLTAGSRLADAKHRG